MVWDAKEIEEYRTKRKKELGPIYALAKIPINNPEQRFNLLKEKYPNDFAFPTKIDQEKLGKVEALIGIERRVVERYF